MKKIIFVTVAMIFGCKSMEAPRRTAELLAAQTANVEALGNELVNTSQDIARARLRTINEIERNAEDVEQTIERQRAVMAIGDRKPALESLELLLNSVHAESDARDAAAERERQRKQLIDEIDARPGFNPSELSQAGQALADLAREKDLLDELVFHTRFLAAAASTISASVRDLARAKEAAIENESELTKEANNVE
jgi:hypothetical protein